MLINAHTHRQLHHAAIELVSLEPGSTADPRWFSCGIHPWHLNAGTGEASMNDLREMASREECLAIGECGLDKLSKAPLDLQERFFTRQIELANELGKPLVVHCVRAFNELLNCLHIAGNQVPVIIHGFNNNENTARLLANEGFYLSFGKALMGYESNASRAIRTAGRKKILLETDDAEVAISDLYRKASELLGIDEAILEVQVQQNFETAFNIRL